MIQFNEDIFQKNGLVKLELDLLYHGCNDIVFSPVDCGLVRRNNFGMQHWIRVPIVWPHCPLDLWRKATCVVATMVGPLTMLLGEKKKGGIFGVKKGCGGWNGIGMMLHILLYVYCDSGLVALIEVVVVADEKTAMHYKSEEIHWIWVQGKMFIFASHGSLCFNSKHFRSLSLPFLKAVIAGLCGLVVRVGIGTNSEQLFRGKPLDGKYDS